MVLYPIGSTKGCSLCAQKLKKAGISLLDHPAPEVTHLLLDVPAFGSEGKLRSGEYLHTYLQMLPPGTIVLGGNLNHPSLTGYRCIDLLQDADYLAQNAAITAECALKLTAPRMDFVFRDCPVLVIGWGRIGKCLAGLLKALNCIVTVAARKETDRAMLRALGYQALGMGEIANILPEIKLLYNTVPTPVLEKPVPDTCIAFELASQNGISGDHVIPARGLPGKYAPESAGNLMTQTILRLCKEDIG